MTKFNYSTLNPAAFYNRNNISVTAVQNKVVGRVFYTSVSQPPGRGPVPGPGIYYTGPRDVLLEFVILVF